VQRGSEVHAVDNESHPSDDKPNRVWQETCEKFEVAQEANDDTEIDHKDVSLSLMQRRQRAVINETIIKSIIYAIWK
jgi:hypothetical protein